MISGETIKEILSQYKKYGWQLQRVILTENLKKSLSDSLETLFGQTEIAAGSFDGAWFSRPSKGNATAWELRLLNDSPFALIEVIENELDDDEREEILQITERKMAERK